MSGKTALGIVFLFLLVIAGVGVWLFLREKTPPGPDVQYVEPSDIAERVHEFCGKCHAYPPPESFPAALLVLPLAALASHKIRRPYPSSSSPESVHSKAGESGNRNRNRHNVQKCNFALRNRSAGNRENRAELALNFSGRQRAAIVDATTCRATCEANMRSNKVRP